MEGRRYWMCWPPSTTEISKPAASQRRGDAGSSVQTRPIERICSQAEIPAAIRQDHQVTSVCAKPGSRTSGTRNSAQKIPKYETVLPLTSNPSASIAAGSTSNRPISKCSAIELNARPNSAFAHGETPSPEGGGGYKRTTTGRVPRHDQRSRQTVSRISRVYPNPVESHHKQREGEDGPRWRTGT